MDFQLSDEQRILADTANDFAAKRSPVSRFRKLRDQAPGWEPAVWCEMGELGWLSVPFAEAVGGYGGSFLEAALILEALGKHLVPEPYAPHLVACYGLAASNNEALIAEVLTPALMGETVLAHAYAEAETRFDPVGKATLTPAGSGFSLSGRKVWVPAGHAADWFVVTARAPEGPAVVVVPKGEAGVTVTEVKTIDGRFAAMLEFAQTPVPAARIVAAPGASGAMLAEALFDTGAAAAVAEGVGVAQTAFQMTLAYLNTREQFGVKIGSFQALQHRAVDMFVELELLRSAALAAILRLEEEPSMRAYNVSVGKVQLGRGGKLITQESLQLHGGIGITDEHDIGLYFKRMHVLNTLYGDEQHHIARVAPSLFA